MIGAGLSMQPVKILLSGAALVAAVLPAAAAPDDDLLAKPARDPIGTRANWYYEESVRVGSFSNVDKILPHYTLPKSAMPLSLPRASVEPKIEYRFDKQ